MDIIQDYLINPSSNISTEKGAHKWTKELRDFDNEVYRIGKKVNLSSLLKPDNYSELLDVFIKNPHGFNPVFQYHFPSKEKIESTKHALRELKKTAHHLEQS